MTKRLRADFFETLEVRVLLPWGRFLIAGRFLMVLVPGKTEGPDLGKPAVVLSLRMQEVWVRPLEGPPPSSSTASVVLTRGQGKVPLRRSSPSPLEDPLPLL